MSFFRSLHVQVLLSIVIGIALGHFSPEWGEAMKPLGDGFIKLIKMIIAPIIFCTIVTGIAGMDDMKKVGRVGAKALLYFEVVTVFALILGLFAVNWMAPGQGMNVDVASLDAKAVASYTTGGAAQAHSTQDFFLNLIPSTVVDAFAKGDILQVLLVSLLFGWALSSMGKETRLFTLITELSHCLFRLVDLIMRLAPIGTFGAMAFTIGKYGIASLLPLGELLLCFFATCTLFIIFVFGPIAYWAGINLWSFLSYIKEELLIVFGTASSESVLPKIMEKLERMGCGKSIVGLVVPTGYSFNLDGTSIYLTMSAIFVAQATNCDLSLSQQLTILAVLLLTSKGASGVTGSGFIVLAATLSVIPGIPVAGLALIFGIDRFMSQGRALTNLIGNGIATIVIAKWENEFDSSKLEDLRQRRAHPELMEERQTA